MPGPSNPSQVRQKHRGPRGRYTNSSTDTFDRGYMFNTAWGSNLTATIQRTSIPWMGPNTVQTHLFRATDGYGNYTEAMNGWPDTACTFWYYVTEGVRGGAGSPIRSANIRNTTTATNLLQWNWADWDDTVSINFNNTGGIAEVGIERIPNSRAWRLVWGRVRSGITIGDNMTLYASSGGTFFANDETTVAAPGIYHGYIDPVSFVPHLPRPW